MKTGDPIGNISAAIYACIQSEDIMPTCGRRRPTIDELDVYQFRQEWATTALGFGGIGGQAFTSAYTNVVIYNGFGAVFFNGVHAYSVMVTEPFMNDLSKMDMADVSRSSRYMHFTKLNQQK